MAAAVTAAERGHRVTLFEAHDRLGGQMTLAACVPGKEFAATIAHYAARMKRLGVEVRLSTRANVDALAGKFDEVVIAAGVVPRRIAIPGADGPNVAQYDEVLSGAKKVGERVAIIGTGGIGFDVAVFLTAPESGTQSFLADWSVDPTGAAPGGLKPAAALPAKRRVTMMQRSTKTPGRTLGLTTGWAIRMELARRGVAILAGVEYQSIDARGVHIRHEGVPKLIEADTVVICAGQESERSLYDQLAARGVTAHLIGGAKLATEIDAMRAIKEGTDVALAM